MYTKKKCFGDGKRWGVDKKPMDTENILGRMAKEGVGLDRMHKKTYQKKRIDEEVKNYKRNEYLFRKCIERIDSSVTLSSLCFFCSSIIFCWRMWDTRKCFIFSVFLLICIYATRYLRSEFFFFIFFSILVSRSFHSSFYITRFLATFSMMLLLLLLSSSLLFLHSNDSEWVRSSQMEMMHLRFWIINQFYSSCFFLSILRIMSMRRKMLYGCIDIRIVCFWWHSSLSLFLLYLPLDFDIVCLLFGLFDWWCSIDTMLHSKLYRIWAWDAVSHKV